MGKLLQLGNRCCRRLPLHKTSHAVEIRRESDCHQYNHTIGCGTFKQAVLNIWSHPHLSWKGRSFGNEYDGSSFSGDRGKGRVLTRDELNQLLDQLGLGTQLQ